MIVDTAAAAGTGDRRQVNICLRGRHTCSRLPVLTNVLRKLKLVPGVNLRAFYWRSIRILPVKLYCQYMLPVLYKYISYQYVHQYKYTGSIIIVAESPSTVVDQYMQAYTDLRTPMPHKRSNVEREEGRERERRGLCARWTS